MKNFILLFALIGLFSACKNETSSQTTPVNDPAAATPAPANGNTLVISTKCYIVPSQTKDVRALQLIQSGTEVRGYLAIEPFGQEAAYGEYTGSIFKDEIIGVYISIVKGQLQTEEMVFKMEGGKLLRGVGPLVDKNVGVLTYKDRENLDWSEMYLPTDCLSVKHTIDRAIEADSKIQKLQNGEALPEDTKVPANATRQ